MSPNARRLASILGAALLLGVLGNLLLGASPAAVKPVAAAELPWQPVAMRVPDLAAADQVWEARAPWGAAPKPVEPPPVPTDPGPMARCSSRRQIFVGKQVRRVRDRAQRRTPAQGGCR